MGVSKWMALAALLAASATQAAPVPLPVHAVGRFADGYVHEWPGAYFESRFSGESVTVRVDDAINILAVYIDGQRVATLTKPGKADFTYTTAPGTHTIRLDTLTESQDGTGAFEGFFVPKAKAVQQVTARPRQIEFIGDSFTAGYGNTSAKRECSKDEVWSTTDTQQAWGPLTARHYDADYQVIAYSGIGIVRNYDGVAPRRSMPVLYPSSVFDPPPSVAYAPRDWDPQIVVIALGGNDFSTPVHAGDRWKTLEELRADYIATYVHFVKTVRASHPSAQFLLVDYGEDEVHADVAEVIKRLTADGENRVSPYTAGSGFNRTGCDWHLNLVDDKRIADGLTTYIDAHPALWQGK